METIPFTRQRTVKLFTLGVIGLGILLGSPAVLWRKTTSESVTPIACATAQRPAAWVDYIGKR